MNFFVYLNMIEQLSNNIVMIGKHKPFDFRELYQNYQNEN